MLFSCLPPIVTVHTVPQPQLVWDLSHLTNSTAKESRNSFKSRAHWGRSPLLVYPSMRLKSRPLSYLSIAATKNFLKCISFSMFHTQTFTANQSLLPPITSGGPQYQPLWSRRDADLLQVHWVSLYDIRGCMGEITAEVCTVQILPCYWHVSAVIIIEMISRAVDLSLCGYSALMVLSTYGVQDHSSTSLEPPCARSFGYLPTYLLPPTTFLSH